jgi:lysozyme
MSPNQKVAAISAAVVALATPVVVFHEGERLNPYYDPVGIVTDCFGHTKTAKMGAKNTHEDCVRKLREDFAEHNAGMLQCLKTPLADNVHAAMLSFTFNVGVAAFCRSQLLQKLNTGDVAGACAELSRWVYAGGKALPGLIKRRANERALCEGHPPSLGVIG